MLLVLKSFMKNDWLRSQASLTEINLRGKIPSRTHLDFIKCSTSSVHCVF